MIIRNKCYSKQWDGDEQAFLLILSLKSMQMISMVRLREGRKFFSFGFPSE